jgi:hypothetical protein
LLGFGALPLFFLAIWVVDVGEIEGEGGNTGPGLTDLPGLAFCGLLLAVCQ